MVFDVKDFDGELHVPFKHTYAPAGNITIRNLPKFIHYVHSFQMHAIARIALFRDAHLAQTYPELAVHSRALRQALAGKRQAGLDGSFQPCGAGL